MEKIDMTTKLSGRCEAHKYQCMVAKGIVCYLKDYPGLWDPSSEFYEDVTDSTERKKKEIISLEGSNYHMIDLTDKYATLIPSSNYTEVISRWEAARIKRNEYYKKK